MNEFILPFDSSNTTLAVVGGKGASLSRLAQTGFPVPPGFLVTTAAYKRFVDPRGHLNRKLLLRVRVT